MITLLVFFAIERLGLVLPGTDRSRTIFTSLLLSIRVHLDLLRVSWLEQLDNLVVASLCGKDQSSIATLCEEVRTTRARDSAASQPAASPQVSYSISAMGGADRA